MDGMVEKFENICSTDKKVNLSSSLLQPVFPLNYVS